MWEVFGFSLERYWKKTSNNQKYYNQALMKNKKTAFLSFLIQTFKNWDALVGSFLRQYAHPRNWKQKCDEKKSLVLNLV